MPSSEADENNSRWVLPTQSPPPWPVVLPHLGSTVFLLWIMGPLHLLVGIRDCMHVGSLGL